MLKDHSRSRLHQCVPVYWSGGVVYGYPETYQSVVTRETPVITQQGKRSIRVNEGYPWCPSTGKFEENFFSFHSSGEGEERRGGLYSYPKHFLM